MNKIDWHIKCEENKKKCIIYEDSEGKFPIMQLDIITETHKDFAHGHIKLEKLKPFEILFIEGMNKQLITSPKVKITKQQK